MNAKPPDEEALFHAARRIETAEERDRFIEQATAGDAALAVRVRVLLEMHEREPVYTPAEAPTADLEPIAEHVGTKIGPYALREQIGEGGFGLVFLAEQSSPIRRKVALKIL